MGIGEFAVSGDPSVELTTFSLGSCVGVAMYDPGVRVAGLLHAMLPLSSANPDKAASFPAMYADTGTQALLAAMFDHGATRAGLIVHVIGASTTLDPDGVFRIGERNHAVVRKVLWKNRLFVASEDVGGNVSRSVYLRVEDGRTLVRSHGRSRQLG